MAKIKPWKGICSKSCWYAKGKRCRCKCGGKYHGAGVYIENTIGVRESVLTQKQLKLFLEHERLKETRKEESIEDKGLSDDRFGYNKLGVPRK